MSVAKIFAIRVRFAGIIWGLCAYLEGTQLRQGIGPRLFIGYYLGVMRIFGENTATPRIRTPSGSRVLFWVYVHMDIRLNPLKTIIVYYDVDLCNIGFVRVI